MDWIRRNWPDLLIGIALVAVIAGIIATLLTGGSFFPLGQSNRAGDRQKVVPQSGISGSLQANPEPASSSDRSSQRPSGASADGSVTASNGAGNSGSGGLRDSRTGSAAGTTSDQAGAPATVAPRPVAVTALPFPGSSGAEAEANQGSAQSPAAGSAGEGTVATPSSSGSSSTTTGGSVSSSPTPAATGQQADRSASNPGANEGVYRVSVGAFSSAENAERQAATFRDAGYPVFIGAQGDLSIVLVGPYDDRGEAERVAERIRAGNFRIEPVIYRFRPEATASAASTASTNAVASTASTAPPAPAASSSVPENRSGGAAALTAASPAAGEVQTTASEASGARFLQVGAYATAESAAPQRKRLEGLGFRVSQRNEGNLLKLLVGPFAGEEFVAARARLSEQGIEHFPR